ncbi:YjbE family putative metal transport protein [Veillonella infantium]|uniref:YjbE family putative metal transport protein n=1 Tax=Veillonella infantium TaxID=1911679 RepID=UPI0026EB2E57|nr:YjbE family putative metal transport protein [Veillonella infantium]
MFSAAWFAALGSILLLDLILSGCGMCSLYIPAHPHGPNQGATTCQLLKAMIIGCMGAVIIRVLLTLFATELLGLPYLQFIGGILLLYIAVKLLTDHGDDKAGDKQPTTLMAAVRTIIIADFIMSLDNVLSLAGVANMVPEGKWSLIICGLMISLPIVLCGAQLFLMIMKKLPGLVYVGGGILAYTAAEMMVMDRVIGVYLVEWSLIIKVVLVLMILSFGWFKNHKSCNC